MKHNKMPLVVSMSDVQNFKRCRKIFDLSYVRKLSPLDTTRDVVKMGSEFHEIAAAGARALCGKPTGEFNRQSPMWEVAKQYFDRFPLPAAEDIVHIEDPIYTLVLEETETRGALYLRTTYDLVYVNHATDTLRGRDYKTFSVMPSLYVDLDFQGRIYTCTLARSPLAKKIGKFVDFEWEHVRQETGRELSDGKGKPKKWVEWTDDERYVNVPMVMTDTERDTTWSELVDTCEDLLRAIDENRMYRVDLKTGPHSCNSCFYRLLCVAEYEHGALDDSDLAIMARPTDPAERMTTGGILTDPRVLHVQDTQNTTAIEAARVVYGNTGAKLLEDL